MRHLLRLLLLLDSSLLYNLILMSCSRMNPSVSSFKSNLSLLWKESPSLCLPTSFLSGKQAIASHNCRIRSACGIKSITTTVLPIPPHKIPLLFRTQGSSATQENIYRSERMIRAGQSKYSKKEGAKEPNNRMQHQHQQPQQQQQLQRHVIRADHQNKDGPDGGSAGFPPPFGSPTAALVAAHAHAKHTAAEYHDAKSGPLSPGGAVASPINRSCLNPKAEALAEAHRGRVEAEAQAYLESEIRKLEARAQKLQSKAERKKMHEEAKALEARKREEVKAEKLIQDAEVKADRILCKAREDANRLKAHASEQTEKAIADAYTRAERWKAEIEETKQKDLAEITDRVHLMIAIGELPSAQEHKGVVSRMKQSWACHP